MLDLCYKPIQNGEEILTMIPEHSAPGNDGYAFAPDGQLVNFSHILVDPLTDFGYSGGGE